MVLALAAVLALASGSDSVVAGRSTSVRADASRARLTSSVRPAADITLPPLPADCVPQNEIQVQLGVYAMFTGSFTVIGPHGPQLSASVSGWFCGIGTVINPPPGACPSGTLAAVQLYIPTNGQVFNIPGVEITMVPGLTPEVANTRIVPQPITTVVCAVATNPAGPLHVVLTASITAAAGLFGASCDIGPLRIPLSGIIYGPLSGFSFVFASNPFGIPAASPTGYCPSNVTTALNRLFGFPLAPGGAKISLSGTGEVYSCNPSDIVDSKPVCPLPG